MKFILSPSKEQRLASENPIRDNFDYTKPLFQSKSHQLLKILKSMKEEEISKAFKIKGKILENTKNNIDDFDKKTAMPAISLYNGVAFKELELDTYKKENLIFASENMLIFSAFYGLLRPFDEVKPYRLDMTINIIDGGLYKFWKKEINEYLIKNCANETIVNLASQEFSKILDRKALAKNNISIIDVDLTRGAEKGAKISSTQAKKMRGSLANEIIKNRSYEVIDKIM